MEPSGTETSIYTLYMFCAQEPTASNALPAFPSFAYVLVPLKSVKKNLSSILPGLLFSFSLRWDMNSKEQWMGSYKKDPSSLFFEALFPRLREVLSFSILVRFSVSFKLIWGASLSQSSGRMGIFQSSVRIKDSCSLDSDPWKGRTGPKGKDGILKKRSQMKWNEEKDTAEKRPFCGGWACVVGADKSFLFLNQYKDF